MEPERNYTQTPPPEIGSLCPPDQKSPGGGTQAAGMQSVLNLLNEVLDHVPAVDLPSDGAEVTNFKPQTDPAKKYHLEGAIGSGGMGTVFKVFDNDLRRWVAMKVVRQDAAKSRELLTRFVEEAQVGGQLEHPNIPPVHEMGIDANGQIYFTMKLVRGRTLHQIARDLALGRPEVRREFTPIRLAQILQQAAMGVHYANVRGVIHRDLKPENIMVGDYGEVLVMDWGLAKVVGEHSEAFLLGEDPVVTGRMESGLVTLAGMVQGTPAYMSPEQARGELELIDARTDVYCLGAVLYELLSFQPPHRGRTVEEILDAARASNPPPPSQAAPKGVKVPPDLEAICMKALARERDERYASTREFQEDLQSYIEGTRDRDRRRSEALKLLAEARKHIAAYKELERKRARLKMEVAKVAETIQSHDAVDKKKMLWAIEDATKKLEVDAAKESSAGRNSLHAAIQADPECAEARRTLADLYWERFLEAEGHRDLTTAEFYRGLVEASDDGRYAPLLQGDGKLSVQTTPSGADATLYRFVEEERILRPREPRLLGRTPFNPLSIPMGSYLLVLRKEGYRDVRYPVSMGRGESHAARVRLYPEAEIGKEFLYVPAGEFLRGGDRESWSGFEGGRVAVGDFFIARFPVTMGEYCAFLDALRDRGAAVAEHIPRQGEQVYVELGPDGKYRSSPEFLEGEAASQSSPEVARSCPVLALSWDSAMEYARWRSGIDGREYSLPPEDAWEKAARGVDGRFYPWGDHFEWTFVKGGLSRSGRAQPEPVGSFPADESPYGVRDMAGTIREWTSSWFNEKSGLRAVRGGSWNQVAAWQFRCATRFGFRPSARTTTFGFRLHARPPAAG